MFLLSQLSGCIMSNNYDIISLEPEDDFEENYKDISYGDTQPLKLAIAAMISPLRIRSNYYGLHHYLSDKIEQPVNFIQRSTYGEINEMLKYGEIDIALICTWSYIEVNKDLGLDIIAIPVMDGKSEYRSYIIASKDSNIHKLEDFYNKKFAFTDTLSFSGRLYVLYLLNKQNYLPELFFANYIYTQSHDNSITAVANGLVDGAVVASYVYDAISKKYPEITDNIRIIEVSGAVSNPPVVMSSDISSDLKDRISQLFLQMHNNPEGQSILNEMGIDHFIKGEEADYNYINEILESIY